MKNNTRNRVLFRVPYLIVHHRANIVEDWDMHIGAECISVLKGNWPKLIAFDYL